MSSCTMQETLPVGLFKMFEDGCKNSSTVNGTYCLVTISKIYIDIQSSTSFLVCMCLHMTSISVLKFIPYNWEYW